MTTTARLSKQPNIYPADTCLLSASAVGNDTGPPGVFYITDSIYNTWSKYRPSQNPGRAAGLTDFKSQLVLLFPSSLLTLAQLI